MRLGSWSPYSVYKKGRYVALPRVGAVLLPGKLATQFAHHCEDLVSRVARESVPCHDKPIAVYVGEKMIAYPVNLPSVLVTEDNIFPHKPKLMGKTVSGTEVRIDTDYTEDSFAHLAHMHECLFPTSSLFVACPTCVSGYEKCGPIHFLAQSYDDWFVLLCTGRIV